MGKINFGRLFIYQLIICNFMKKDKIIIFFDD